MDNLHDSTFNLTYFYIALIASLIGSLIGHFKINGVITFPVVYIYYSKNVSFKNCSWYEYFWKIPLLIIDFILFLVGFRFGRNTDSGSLTLEPGFFGDLLVGVGTGILAYAAVGASGAKGIFIVLTTSLLAGYGGFTYIQKAQGKEEDKNFKESKMPEIDITDPKEDVPEKIVAIEEIKKAETAATRESHD
ncbi:MULTISPECIES: hypothetical protein [Bacillus amyloliquefaciens group]|uniref:Uncharacterized protein n=1 Tax=Bacillus amyloliquefaciens (strain Y2) TaxID=1155777 RepID=I2C5J7_BACAY|nr:MULTISPECIES: hypothetical protein [Bacillus amyloliquefaciens group]AFJ61921.1 hypothetical protein MUS_1948 [Bacillus velezensis YAU B9601-Y2]AUG35891.1 hypothetical protein CXP43_09190 [Bacillus velezensis]MCK6102330.1 hypothetical protein [Bacillus velezensis]MCK6203379.1 hypothetical protein [Bacillus velezensis]MCP9020043.1 hypothetical protein [Bacillus velezensis]